MTVYALHVGLEGVVPSYYAYQRRLGVFSSLSLAQQYAESMLDQDVAWEETNYGGIYAALSPGKFRGAYVRLKWFQIEAFEIDGALNPSHA